jgi:hypothetical protein
VRPFVDGRGGTLGSGGVLHGPLPGAGLSATAGVAERRYGNGLGERLAVSTNTPCFAAELMTNGGCLERPRFTLRLHVSRPRHREW